MAKALFVEVVLIAFSRGQTPQPNGDLPSVLQSFCVMDLSGKRLTPGGARDVAKQRLLTELAWEQPKQVIVVSDYAQQPLLVHTSDATFTVEYRTLGRLDSSLGFVRVLTPYTNQPLSQSERISLVWTDTHFELAANGKLQPVKGTPEWRLKTVPVTPHVGVMAAIQYVRMASSRTQDPMLKARAQKTLADLEVLSQFQSMPMQAASPSPQGPEDILSQFVQMQMDGAGLSPGEFSQVSMFLVHPAQWRQDKLGVARGFGVQRTAFAFNKAEAYVQYEAVGEIDLQLRFTSWSAIGNNVRQTYKLVFDNDYSSVPTGGGPYGKIGPSRWRIEDAGPEQWVSVTTALKYVTQMRDSTRDPSIKANADKTLAVLKSLR